MRYLFLLTFFLAAFPAFSDTTPATPVPFEQAVFDEALAQGRPARASLDGVGIGDYWRARPERRRQVAGDGGP